jgi:nucleotide-binding universal stress UspA family protein
MSSYLRRPVLVGVDGSRGSLHALGLAAAEASLRRLPLRIVHVARVDVRAGRALVADARARAVRRYPDLAIDVDVVRGYRPGPVLVDESAHAALTVLGCRGLSELSGTLTGSVSSHVACHGYGPVMVVRGDRYEPSGRYVVVGVDGSAGCDAAVGFAFEEAALRGVPLRATLVWVHPPLADLGDVAPPGYRLADAQRDAAVELDTALAGWRQKYPDVPVRPVLVHSRHAARKLLAATCGADLIVVGSGGHGEIRGLLGGSIGHTLVHHAECPVAVVHEERTH